MRYKGKEIPATEFIRAGEVERRWSQIRSLVNTSETLLRAKRDLARLLAESAKDEPVYAEMLDAIGRYVYQEGWE